MTRWLRSSFFVAIVFGLGGESSAPALGERAIDCVALFGRAPDYAGRPLDQLPLSGVPRNKRVGELTDAELARFSDYYACIGQPYRAACYYESTAEREYPPAPFRLEAPTILSDVVEVCSLDSPASPSRSHSCENRDLCMDSLRRYNGRCPVDLSEDCARALASLTLGGGLQADEVCRAWEHACGFF